MLSIARTFSHWNAKLVTSDFDFGIGQQPADLRVEHLGVGEPALLGHVEQLVVRQPAREEEREARRQIEIADAVDGARRDVVRQPFGAEQKLRAGQNGRQPVPDGRVEIAGRPRVR